MNKIVILAIVLAVMWSGQAVSAASNVPDGQAGTDGAVYPVTLPGYYSGYGTLYDVVPLDYDVYVLTVTSGTTVTAYIEDCCIMGDTIGLFRSKSKYVSATSPATITVSKFLNPGTYKVGVGYLDCPGGFPAGYYATFSG